MKVNRSSKQLNAHAGLELRSPYGNLKLGFVYIQLKRKPL